jgi:HTH-type transcriptional regulator, sugar sensing transcriptional regulator
MSNPWTRNYLCRSVESSRQIFRLHRGLPPVPRAHTCVRGAGSRRLTAHLGDGSMEQDRLVDALQALGFTAYEAKVYRALLKLGAPGKGYEIARSAGVPTSKVYETLKRLAEKGAVMVNTSEPVTYAPIPHRDLTARLREKMEATFSSAEAEFEAIPRGGEPGLTWTVSGSHNVLDLMRRVIARAEHNLFAALWDDELQNLGELLEAAHARNIELQVAIYGTYRISVPFSYDLALCGASAQERLGGRRLSVLIRDGVEAVAAETYPGGAEAIWSENRVFSLLCNEYAKSDIMGRCLIDALGEQAYRRLRHERPELRMMLRSEPLPGSGVPKQRRPHVR